MSGDRLEEVILDPDSNGLARVIACVMVAKRALGLDVDTAVEICSDAILHWNPEAAE